MTSYTCQTGTTIESIVSNAGDAVGNLNACQTGAIRESTTSNACDTVGNNRILTTGNKRIGRCFDNRIAVFSTIIRSLIR